jgi:ATP-binding cassette subfamily B protein
MNRAGGAITSINDVIVYNFLPLAVSIIGVLGSLFVLDWVSAVVTVSIIVCFVTFTSIMLAKQLPLQEAQQGAEDSEKAFISDSFTNIESIKLYAKELFMGRRYGQIAHTTAQADVKYNDWYRWIESGQNAISGIGIGSILFVTAYQFLYSDLAVSTIVFTYTVVLGLIAQLYGFNWGLRAITRGFMDLESARSYLDITADIIDEKKSKPLIIKKGSIAFEDVTFSYAKKRVFDSFSLMIPSKKRVAFVGHSGSGKSTLLKLLFRLYNVDSGRILIDGQDIKTVTQNSVRNAIAIVPQECLLFDDTLYQNVLFAREDATREEVMKAMSLAQLDDVLAQLPSGEKTIVGERGVKLSGGEKQRVSLARAILAQRPVLVLDEATSALDSETEHKIQQALAHALQGRTSVIIAHRLSTIMTADVIVVLKHGKIVQMGTHNELVKVGEYKKLWDLQKGGYIA